MTRPAEPSAEILEIRTYKLAPGTRDEFDRIVRHGALPMLRQHGIRVVGYGPSVDYDDHYYLMRAFASAAERKQQLGAFYGSDEWRDNHRDAVMALIETYHTVAIELTPALRDALLARRS